jgi:erythronate-4-phosphate dehydrogenase
MLRILADANIPHAEDLFAAFGRVEVRPGAALDARTVADADVLLVRSVTVVDADLLRGSRVRFVGSATIGTDHVDLDFLATEGIAFAHAPGSNAESVVEYVLAALLAVLAARGEALRGRTVGVVGCGAIGGRLALRLPALGAEVLRNDPPLAEASGVQWEYHPLDAVLDRADVLTLHPPLTRTGPYPTHHLIGARELEALRPGALLVNASRGAVVDNAALREALGAGRLGGAVLDVWEGEPSPDPAVLARCALGTPHIAGYSYDGKVEGARMLAAALAAWLRQEPSETSLPEPEALPPL